MQQIESHAIVVNCEINCVFHSSQAPDISGRDAMGAGRDPNLIEQFARIARSIDESVSYVKALYGCEIA